MKGVYIIGDEMINLSAIKGICMKDDFILFIAITGRNFVFDSNEYDIKQIWEQIITMQEEGFAVTHYE